MRGRQRRIRELVLRRRAPRPAALAALAGLAAAASSCGISLQSLPKLGGVSGPTYQLTATFANVVNLPDNAQVRVGAFQVGYVSSIKAVHFAAVVSMRIKRGTRLPSGTTAAIHFDTPLGEDFVQLQTPTPQAAPYLADGAVIPESRTATAPSVEDAFAALGALLNGGGIDQLQTIITQTNLALSGNQANLRSLIQSLDATVSSFADNTPAIDRALQAIASLSQVLNAGSSTITRGIAALGPAAAVLAGESSDLDKLLSQLDRLGSVANAILAASTTGTVQTVQALKPLLDELVSVKQQVGPTLSAVSALESRTPAATPGDYLQLSVDATLDVPPVPAGAPPLQKVTVDPPEATQSYDRSAIATLLESGLP